MLEEAQGTASPNTHKAVLMTNHCRHHRWCPPWLLHFGTNAAVRSRVAILVALAFGDKATRDLFCPHGTQGSCKKNLTGIHGLGHLVSGPIYIPRSYGGPQRAFVYEGVFLLIFTTLEIKQRNYLLILFKHKINL